MGFFSRYFECCFSSQDHCKKKQTDRVEALIVTKEERRLDIEEQAKKSLAEKERLEGERAHREYLQHIELCLEKANARMQRASLSR